MPIGRSTVAEVNKQGHDHPEQPGTSWLKRTGHRVGHVINHDHGHQPNVELLHTGAIGIRATKVSLLGLGITAALQAIIFGFESPVVAIIHVEPYEVEDSHDAVSHHTKRN